MCGVRRRRCAQRAGPALCSVSLAAGCYAASTGMSATERNVLQESICV